MLKNSDKFEKEGEVLVEIGLEDDKIVVIDK
jgi:hypothetical protein